MTAATPTPIDKAAEAVLTAHQRHKGGCLCGWADLGKSHPAHQTQQLRQAQLLHDDAATHTTG